MRLARLTGTIYDSTKTEDILKRLVELGAFSSAIASREIVIELPVDRVDEAKDMLKRFRVTDLKVRETRIIETTVTQAGTGTDPDEVVRVSLAPAARAAGFKLVHIDIAATKEKNVRELEQIYANFVRFVLQKAGVTDVLCSVEVLKKRDDMESALEMATKNALFNSNGTIQINA